MADYLRSKVAVVLGDGGAAHRGVAVALAQAGADVAVGGSAPDLPAQAALHSIANEVWALGRRSAVVVLEGTDAASFAQAVGRASSELGRVDLVVRCEPVLPA